MANEHETNIQDQTLSAVSGQPALGARGLMSFGGDRKGQIGSAIMVIQAEPTQSPHGLLVCRRDHEVMAHTNHPYVYAIHTHILSLSFSHVHGLPQKVQQNRCQQYDLFKSSCITLVVYSYFSGLKMFLECCLTMSFQMLFFPPQLLYLLAGFFASLGVVCKVALHYI